MAADFVECHDCNKVLPVEERTDRCPSCGSTRVEPHSAEHVERAMKAGTYFNLGPNGKRAKKKKRS